MANPPAPPALREAFRDGVDDYVREPDGGFTLVASREQIAYPGALRLCWLAQFDPARRPCSSTGFERFHFIRRQDVEAALWQNLPADGAWFSLDDVTEFEPGVLVPETFQAWQFVGRWDLIHVAAWDARNGAHACEQHHRRYDNHQVSLPRERVIVPRAALPGRVVEFTDDYGLERLLERFPR